MLPKKSDSDKKKWSRDPYWSEQLRQFAEENAKTPFKLQVCVNDAPFQENTVTPSTTIRELNNDAILIWKDTAIVYAVTEGNGVGPATTLQQLCVTSLSKLYIYTTAFPCPSGDLRSIIPAQVRLINQFANPASSLFNQAKTTAPSSSTVKTQKKGKPSTEELYGPLKRVLKVHGLLTDLQLSAANVQEVLYDYFTRGSVTKFVGKPRLEVIRDKLKELGREVKFKGEPAIIKECTKYFRELAGTVKAGPLAPIWIPQ